MNHKIADEYLDIFFIMFGSEKWEKSVLTIENTVEIYAIHNGFFNKNLGALSKQW